MDEPKVKKSYKEFAMAYCGCGNAEKAAKMAGYSAKYARGNAYKLLANSGVKLYIQYINNIKDPENIKTVQEIQEFWSRLIDDKEISLKYRLKASELLAKAIGMFNDEW